MAGHKRKIIDGEALRRARMRKGMTTRELAQACGELGCKIDHANIFKAENNIRAIGVRKLPTLARALGLEVDDLLADEAAA